MTIDISNLSPEQRAFLKVNPDLLKSLERGIPQQVRAFQSRKEKLKKSKSPLQRELDKGSEEKCKAKAELERLRKRAERLKRKVKSSHQKEMAELQAKIRKYEFRLDPALRKIQRKLEEKLTVTSKMVCPNCGDPDRGNKVNGKPWCFKCNTILVAKDKLQKWLKLPKVKEAHDSRKDEFKRRGLDF